MVLTFNYIFNYLILIMINILMEYIFSAMFIVFKWWEDFNFRIWG